MKKISFFTLFIALCTISVASFIGYNAIVTAEGENDFTKFVNRQMEVLDKAFPQERIYLHLDKSFYAPGETIWFSAYVRSAINMAATNKSDLIQVQLISPKGTIQNEYKLICRNGKANGDFLLDETLPGGIYKIKAFSRWQKNEPDSMFFEKEIQVQSVIIPRLKMKLDFERKAFGKGDEVIAKLTLETNSNKPLSNYPFSFTAKLQGDKIASANSQTGNDGEMYIKFNLPKKIESNDGLLNVTIDYEGQTESISRSIPIVLENISLKFYPEGGELINGIPTRVAFAAKNEFGKPADVEGVIIDGKGNVISDFKSFHNGMGAFNLPCHDNEQYSAKILKPAGIDNEFILPQLLDEGYVLNTESTDIHNVSVTVQTKKAEELSLVAQVRGKIYYSAKIDAQLGKNQLLVPTLKMPMGVCQITLFDSKGIAQCERLVFVNKYKQLQIEITTNKEKYLTREKVFATVIVKDEMGVPSAASLSLSVTNDELLSFANDKQGNLLSQLYLQQDIKGKVEEPSFYFSKEAKANEALDYLLMTSGWRRFKWKKVLSNEAINPNYFPEKTRVNLQLTNAKTMQPVGNASVKIGKIVLQSNEHGKIIYNKINLYEPVKVNIEMDGFDKCEDIINNYQEENEVKSILLYPIGFKREEAERRLKFERMMEFEAKEMNAAVMQPMKAMADNPNNNEQVRKEAEANAKARAESELKHKAIANVKAVADKEEAKEKGIENRPDEEKLKEEQNVENDELLNRNADAKIAAAREVAAFKKMIPIVQKPQVKLYRAREFAVPDYSQETTTQVRNDFRKTIYWNPNFEVDNTGKRTFEFYTSDEIASFKIITEGIGSNGYGAHNEKNIFTQLPFSMSIKMPHDLIQDDAISLPIALKNNTTKNLTGILSIQVPKELKFISISNSNIPSGQVSIKSDVSIEAGNTTIVYANFIAGTRVENEKINVSFASENESDSFEQEFTINAKGFPISASYSGKESNTVFSVNISELVPGSLVASATAYPSVVSDLLKGVESILREPNGCFEQTSMSSYPNVLVRDYLKNTGINDSKIESRADALIERGYKKLVSFETPQKGYEWFGGAPGHEALSAYGLMQFVDMKYVYSGVDNAMIDRTANWLLASKDGKGGYRRNPRALDNFGGANQDITDAYITYALACARFENIDLEIDHLYELAKQGKDPYIMALAANALFAHHKDKRANLILEELIKKQEPDGSFMGSIHSITRSTHKALRVETTSLAVLAMLQSDLVFVKNISDALDFIVKSRNGNGDFGNSQSTIMALKALTKFAETNKQTNEDGVIQVFVDNKLVAEKEYKAGEKNAMTINGLEKYLDEGKHKLQLKYKNEKTSMPYSISINWNSTNPVSSEKCLVDLDTKLSTKLAKMGETVRLAIKLSNKTNEGLPSTMAIIGIPSGCSAQPWQLKELQEKRIIDYYETNGNMLNIYFRQMAPSEVKTIDLDLKTEVPGQYLAPASTAYLYYTNEFKIWKELDKLEIK